jgi:hypothetical protein
VRGAIAAKQRASKIGRLSGGGIRREEKSSMFIQTHRVALERQHQALEQDIYEAQMHPSRDNLKIAELKRRKLLVKDEIARTH